MFVAIFESPVGVAMKFAGWNTTNSDKWPTSTLGAIVSPRYTCLGGKFSNVFVVFEISPKFGLSAGLDL